MAIYGSKMGRFFLSNMRMMRINAHRCESDAHRQIHVHGQPQFKFLLKNNLVPETAKCEDCDGLLDKVYPINDPGAKFKYYRCPCNNKQKIPVFKETFLHKANISVRQYVALLYGFTYRLKYDDVKREADIEGPDTKDEEGYHEKKLSDATISYWYEVFRLAIGQEMVERETDKKIGGVNMEVEIDESCFGTTKYGRGNPFRHRECWVLGE